MVHRVDDVEEGGMHLHEIDRAEIGDRCRRLARRHLIRGASILEAEARTDDTETRARRAR